LAEREERKLAKLKESVEWEPEVLSEAPAEQPKERRDIERIIERLKSKEKPAPKAEFKEIAEMLMEEKPGEIAQKPVKLDFKRVSADASFREQFKGFGTVFALLQKPVSALASALFKLPVARNVHRELDAANISLGVEAYLVVAVLLSILGGIMVTFFVVLLGIALEDYAIAAAAPFLGVFSVLIFLVVGASYPNVRAKERAISIDRELPFALRQLSTQVKAGLSFNRAMTSVAQSDYGELSVEMKKALRDMDSGATTEEALSKVMYRSKSRGFKRALIQIIRSLRTGGRLSEIIASIADDVSFETRMGIRDFTEVLNIISVVYIMIAVVAPVTLTVLTAVIQLPLIAANIPQAFIVLAFMGIILGIGAIIFVTIRLEPTM
jgi:flagellar protein FlaJ